MNKPTQPTEYLVYAYTLKKKKKTAVFKREGEFYKLVKNS